MKQMLANSYLYGANAPFIEDLYEAYLGNPSAVEPAWRDYFDRLQNLPSVGGSNSLDVAHGPIVASFAQRAKMGTLHAQPAAAQDARQVKVTQLISAYRFLGNRWAQLDPLKRTERPAIAELDPAYYGFTEADLGANFSTASFAFGPEQASLREILGALRQTYCNAIGAEYMHISNAQQKRWLQAMITASVRLVSKRPTRAY